MNRDTLVDKNLPWRLLVHPATASAALAVAYDEALLQHLEKPVLRCWQNTACVVLGKFDTRLPHIGKARAYFNAKGIPLLQRSSGGTAVWQGPGVFNLSVLCPAAVAPAGVHAAFEGLANGMLDGISSLGLNVRFGRASNTYCDGPHNLLVEGRKIAGLAQVRRRQGVLVHASILVQVALPTMHAQLETFYRLAGKPTVFDRAKVTTLAQLTDEAFHFKRLTQLFARSYFSRERDLQPTQATRAEAETASALAVAHLV